MIYEQSITACFTGYRPEKMPYPFTPGNLHYFNLCEKISWAIIEAYNNGYRNFICGMATGFDLAAGCCVISLAKDVNDIKLIAALPFKTHGHDFPEIWRHLHSFILSVAFEKHIIMKNNCKGAYFRRNDWMLEHSSLVIGFHTNKPGGTDYTMVRAIRIGHKIINLADYDCWIEK